MKRRVGDWFSSARHFIKASPLLVDYMCKFIDMSAGI